MPKKNRVALGYTTYINISESEYGIEIHRILSSVSKRLTPIRFKHLGSNFIIDSEHHFSENWCPEYPYEIRENRSSKSKVLESSMLTVPSKWITPGALSGRGEVILPSDKNSLPSYALTIEFNYTPRIEWHELFVKLTKLLKPSYGMLHLFSQEECLGETTDTYTFTGPVSGEHEFTSWLTDNGVRRKPDHFEIEKRRQYIHLPQLAWANHMGPEFNEQYDIQHIKSNAFQATEYDNGIQFITTKELRDVEKNRDEYCKRRSILKKGFRSDFFRL